MWSCGGIVFDSNICRLCGCASDSLLQLESQESENVLTLIKRFIPLNIELKDKKPQQVCSICVSKLENFNSFISTCITTDSTFTNIIDNFKLLESGNKIITIDGKKSNIIFCQNDKIKINANVKSIDTSLLHQNQDFYFMLELNYKETDANKINHQDESSNKEIKEDNEICKDNKNQEDCKQEKIKPFVCNICGKHMSRKSNLASHLALHSNERPYSCNECNKKFATSWDLKVHKHIHSGLYTCETCKKPFETKSKLERHKKSHTGVREYSCPVCKKSFSEKNNMLSHTRIHTGERPYSCSNCKKTFRTQSHLTDHSKVHSSATPYSCDLCGKSFKWRSNLKDHTKYHTGEKFKCTNCKKEFNIRSDCLKHRKECKKKLLKSCTTCYEIFCDSTSYQNHLLSCHKVTPSS